MQRVIGAGGHGRVLLARLDVEEADVALKVLSLEDPHAPRELHIVSFHVMYLRISNAREQ